MRPASPESHSPDTNQGPARSVTPPTAAEPDTTQSGPSRETTEGLVTMMRWVCVCVSDNMHLYTLLGTPVPHLSIVWQQCNTQNHADTSQQCSRQLSKWRTNVISVILTMV